jgi:serine/threonine protein kinase
VKGFGYFNERNQFIIILEYLGQGDVDGYLKKHGKVEEKEVVKWTIQILLALNYLHNKNFIHRDLKPENLMLTGDNDIKIIDMGLARQFEADTSMTQKKT